MSAGIHGDHVEAGAEHPTQALLNWRETRDADRYKQWCIDRLGGVVQIGDYNFHPAQVLTLKEGATERTQATCRVQLKAEDEVTICEQFPAPISVPYYQFLYGPREPSKRLRRMRDTWEGLINLLFALAVSEATQFGIGTHPVKVIQSASSSDVKAADLRTDKLSNRIGLLAGLLDSWRTAGVQSAVLDLLPLGVVEELRRLNSVRNGFSHLGTQSDSQERALIDETAPILHESLVDVLELANVRVMRLSRFVPGAPPSAEVEILKGHSTSRRIDDLPLEPADALLAMQAGRVDVYDRVLAKIGGRMLDLSPYFYAFDDNSGHHTWLAFFKKRNGGQCHLEVVGEAIALASDEAYHADLFARCESALLASNQGGASA